jgi:uncharacterized protein YwqG
MKKMGFEKVDQPILETVSKIGGKPVGLDEFDWPSCKTCNNPMAFLMQIAIGPGTPIEAPDEGLIYIFMCNNPDMVDECKTADPDMGDNKVIVIYYDDMLEGVAEIPDYSNGLLNVYQVTLTDESWPSKCAHCGDTVNDGEIICPSCSTYYAFHSRIGGLLSWIGEQEVPYDSKGEPMEFIAQINWNVGDPNFSMDHFGIGYIFLSFDKKEGKFLYQH